MRRLPIAVPLLFLLAFSACATPAPVTPSLPPSPTVTPAPPTLEPVLNGPTPTPSPGLVVRGRVTLGGQPLAGVKIYRSYASYEGVLIATSGRDGTYRSEFMPIPGDEMVTVWAELEGYTFKPDKEYWRHYYGYEERRVDFVALKP